MGLGRHFLRVWVLGHGRGFGRVGFGYVAEGAVDWVVVFYGRHDGAMRDVRLGDVYEVSEGRVCCAMQAMVDARGCPAVYSKSLGFKQGDVRITDPWIGLRLAGSCAEPPGRTTRATIASAAVTC